MTKLQASSSREQLLQAPFPGFPVHLTWNSVASQQLVEKVMAFVLRSVAVAKRLDSWQESVWRPTADSKSHLSIPSKDDKRSNLGCRTIGLLPFASDMCDSTRWQRLQSDDV